MTVRGDASVRARVRKRTRRPEPHSGHASAAILRFISFCVQKEKSLIKDKQDKTVLQTGTRAHLRKSFGEANGFL